MFIYFITMTMGGLKSRMLASPAKVLCPTSAPPPSEDPTRQEETLGSEEAMRLMRLENHYTSSETSPQTSPQTSPDASPDGNDPDTRLSDEVFAPASWDHQRIHGTDEENDKPSAVDMMSASCEAAPPEDWSWRFIPQFPWVSTGNPLVGATITSFSEDSAGFRGAPDPLGTLLWADESSELEDWFTTPGPLRGPGCEQLSLAGPCESPVGKKVIAIENHCFGQMGRPVWLGDPRG